MAVSISISYKENSQSVTGNKTNVTVEVVASWTYGSYNLNKKPGWVEINGTRYNFTNSFNDNRTTSGSKVLFSKTVDITHNGDGTKKKMPIKASYTSGVSSGTVTASTTVDLTPIARESTVGASDANIGSKSAVVITRNSNDFTHSVAFKFGSLTGYLTAAGGISDTEVKLTALSIAWLIPTEFYAQIPKAKTGTCTLTIRTYLGDAQIGAAKTDTFTVTAAKSLCAPSVSGTVVDINDVTVALTGDDTKLVRYMSTALCTISASAKNSASIAERKIGGVAVSKTSRQIDGIQTDSVAFYVKDSRGYDSTATVKATMVPYIMLTSKASGVRNGPTTGKATLTVKGNFFNGSFGAGDNALTIQYRINGGDPVSVAPKISGNTYSASAALSDLDYQESFDIEVTVSDKLDSRMEMVSIGRGIPTHYWNKNRFVFCVPPYADSLNLEKYLYLGTEGPELETGVSVPWADDALHWLIYRLSDGLTSGIGWPGLNGEKTVTVIRGNTVQCQNASGTTALSDERMKKDFADLSGWEDFFGALDPCAFRLKDGTSGRYHLGFRAQQVEAALKSAGLTSQDFAGLIRMPYQPAEDDTEGAAVYAAAGIHPGDDLYGLIYPEFTALNTYIIQRQQKEISALREEINALRELIVKGGA